MLSSPQTAWLAGLEGVVVACAVLGFGFLLVDLVPSLARRDPILRWGLAFPAVVVYALAVAVLHIVSGGGVLGSALATRSLTILVAAALVAARVARSRDAGRRPDIAAHATAAAVVLAAILVWCTPAFRLLPLDPFQATGGDLPWHMGLASQFLNGETTPSAAITGEIPNYYPWLYHALVALVARFTPGGRTLHALTPLQVLQVGGAVLALLALGTAITGRRAGGVAAALFGGMAGGLGFTMLRGLDVVMRVRGPQRLEYLGDLLFTRSYNSAFANLVPPLPRDVAMTLLLGFLVAVVTGVQARATAVLVAAGALLGLVGLTGAESFVVGFGVGIIAAVLAPGPGRIPAIAALTLPALAVYAIWLVPLIASYRQLGGFVNITRTSAVVLPPIAILVSWGIVVPFGLYGLVLAVRRRRDPGPRVVFGLMAGVAALLLVSPLAVRAGTEFLTLGRTHRYWPFLHVGAALLAAVGAADLLDRAIRRKKWAAVALAGATLGLAVPSPVVASLAVPRKAVADDLTAASLRGDPRTVLNVLADSGEKRCTAAVPPDLDVQAYGYTGYRLVLFRWPRYERNFARIRWAGIYERIPTDSERLVANRLLTSASTPPATWRKVAKEHDVDVVVMPGERVPPGIGRAAASAHGDDGRYVVVRLDDCSGAAPS